MVDKAVVIVFPVSDQTGVISKGAHFRQIVLHIVVVGKEQVTEQAVDGKYG